MRDVILSLLTAATLASAAYAQQAADAVAPEAGTAVAASQTNASPAVSAAHEAKAAGRPVEARTWMVAAANPLAVSAGADVLRDGGTEARRAGDLLQ